MSRGTYPEAVIEILDDNMRYGAATLGAVRKFAASGPWLGSQTSRKRKFRDLNRALSMACDIVEPNLVFGRLDGGSSGASHYIPRDHRIVIVGKLSVVTYLHEFAHALGFDEQEACRWSINLFRECFPRQYSRLLHVGHTLSRPQDVKAALALEHTL
jgi:hypothetical protein